MHFNDREEIIALTPQWKGERLPDGRPKGDEKYLKALKNLTLEEVWKPIFVKGYESQFEGRLHTLHDDGRKLIGRAVTATYCPFRPDLDEVVKDIGRSEGRTITFGIRERHDVLTWVNYVNERFGPDVRIILAGVSMGASTVLMASGMDLPKNVVAIVADCPYSSPKEIICKVARDKGLNDRLVYPLIKLSAKIFANLDIEEASPIEAVKTSKTPTILVHGTDDRYVPYEMGKRVFEACSAQNKKMLSIEGAGHATSYFTKMEFYVKTLNDFLDGVLGK